MYNVDSRTVRHRWYYTYWQDTRDRDSSVTPRPLLIFAIALLKWKTEVELVWAVASCWAKGSSRKIRFISVSGKNIESWGRLSTPCAVTCRNEFLQLLTYTHASSEREKSWKRMYSKAAQSSSEHRNKARGYRVCIGYSWEESCIYVVRSNFTTLHLNPIMIIRVL